MIKFSIKKWRRYNSYLLIKIGTIKNHLGTNSLNILSSKRERLDIGKKFIKEVPP